MHILEIFWWSLVALGVFGAIFGKGSGNQRSLDRNSSHHANDIYINPVRDEIRNSRNRDY